MIVVPGTDAARARRALGDDVAPGGVAVVPRWRVAILLALALAPCVLAAGAVWRHAVNVPYWDEWAIATIYPKARNGHLTFADLIAQHNESRKLFPRLAFLGLAALTGGDVRAPMAVSWLLAAVVSAGLWVLARRTLALRRDAALALWAAANVLLFSLVQHENWLWGIQVIVFVPPACLVTALVVGTSRAPLAARFAAAIALSFVSTYSFANGMLCWPIVLPVLIAHGWRGGDDARARRERAAVRRSSALYVLAFAATVASYFHGFVKPAGHPSYGEVLRAPLAAAAYFLGCLGRSLAGARERPLVAAIVAGAALVGSLVGLGVRWFRAGGDREALRRAAPWLAVAAYPLASTVLTTAGRLGFGVEQALESRYATFSLYFPIALAHLFFALEPSTAPEAARPRVGRVLATLAIGGLVAAGAVTSVGSLDAFRATRARRLEASAVLQWSGLFVDPHSVKVRLYPEVDVFTRVARRLGRIGYLSPPRRDDPHLDLLAAAVAPQPSGYLEAVVNEPDGSTVLSGWAVLRSRAAPADGVLLSFDDEAGRPVAFALTIDRDARPDVARAESCPGCRYAGFRARVATGSLDAARWRSVRAWAFDAAEVRAYPLERLALSESPRRSRRPRGLARQSQ